MAEIPLGPGGHDSGRLYRSRTNKVIAGVCGGLAEHFNIDPIVIRILWVLLSLGYGTGLILYIVLVIIIPEEPGGQY